MNQSRNVGNQLKDKMTEHVYFNDISWKKEQEQDWQQDMLIEDIQHSIEHRLERVRQLQYQQNPE